MAKNLRDRRQARKLKSRAVRAGRSILSICACVLTVLGLATAAPAGDFSDLYCNVVLSAADDFPFLQNADMDETFRSYLRNLDDYFELSPELRKDFWLRRARAPLGPYRKLVGHLLNELKSMRGTLNDPSVAHLLQPIHVLEEDLTKALLERDPFHWKKIELTSRFINLNEERLALHPPGADPSWRDLLMESSTFRSGFKSYYLLTADALTYRHFNTSYGLPIQYLGVTTETLVADGKPMTSAKFIRHDAAHAGIIQERLFRLPGDPDRATLMVELQVWLQMNRVYRELERVYERKSFSDFDRELTDALFFIATHEYPARFTTLEEMQGHFIQRYIERPGELKHIVKRLQDPNDMWIGRLREWKVTGEAIADVIRRMRLN